jgi:hypothetical protein
MRILPFSFLYNDSISVMTEVAEMLFTGKVDKPAFGTI